MLFSSLIFSFFFTGVAIVYYILPNKLKWVWLLLSSIFFYMFANPLYILVPIFTILITYFCAIGIEKSALPRNNNWFFFIGIFLNINILFFFKYSNFFTNSLFDLTNFLKLNVFNSVKSYNNTLLINLIVPIGISYITFQQIGYLIEIKQRNFSAERNLGHFSTYVLFFPKLLAGPVERAHAFLPQLKNNKEFDYFNVTSGLKLIAWGLFKKTVIADRLGIIVDNIYNNLHNNNGIVLIVACLFFTIQLYADFSGYTDMALGFAKVFGFNLTQNFNSPFSSKSLTEFWRKWHISLSTWFADYVFTPLAIQKRNWGKWSIVYSSMITFVFLGFWHGANWTFIIFGTLHGFMLSFEFLTRKTRKRISCKIPNLFINLIGVSFTFIYFSFSLIFFRSNNVNDAFYIILNLTTGLNKFFVNITNQGYIYGIFSGFGVMQKEFIISLVFILILLIFEYLQRNKPIIEIIETKPTYFRWTFYYSLIIVIIFLGSFNSTQQFIYNQF